MFSQMMKPSFKLLKLPQFNLNVVPYSLTMARVRFGHYKPNKGRVRRGQVPGQKGASIKKKPYKMFKKYALKTRTSMITRVKVVGPRWDRQFKFKSPGLKRKISKKNRNNLKRKRRNRYISKADIKRVKKMLPYHKRQKFKRLN